MIFRLVSVCLLTFAIFSVHQSAFAQVQPVPTQNPGAPTQNPGVPTQSSGKTEHLVNPIKATDIVEFILDVIDVILVFATPIIVLYIMYAGFLFVTARGNDSQISEAKTALTWAVIGGVIILGARIILTIIENTIKAF